MAPCFQQWGAASARRFWVLAAQEQIPRTRGNLSELKLLRQGADASAEYRLTAWVARYGYVSFATLQALCEAYEVYTEGCEQVRGWPGMSSSALEGALQGLELNHGAHPTPRTTREQSRVRG